MPRRLQDGSEWKETPFDLVPQWTRDPSIPAIEVVCREHLSIPPEDPCTVFFHTSGLFNKLYIVEYAQRRVIMRVTLPVYPGLKTRAEWILMEFIEGTPAHTRWRTMSMEQKVAFTKQLATFQAELSGFGKPEAMLRGIGTLELREFEKGKEIQGLGKVAPGMLVSHEFFMGDRFQYDIPRGPFHSSRDWLTAELNIVMLDQKAIIDSSEDEDDKEDAEEVITVAQKLLSLIPKVFPPNLDEPETTVLYHHDLHLKNILVSEEGEITAVLDWECVSAMPLWMTTKVPRFLDEPVREEEPQRDTYADETPEQAAAAAERRHDPDYLDSEGKNSLYFIHKMEYEATQLRKVYKATLRQLWPGCPQGEETLMEVNFHHAVSQCDGIWVKMAGRWADRVLAGQSILLEDA
ncbi:uncharacterized protein PODANS_5_12850 [Podospora anserina S mat+]|uniref:Podospora anserina S mat+ genomic DNA chromosome 5, supercontig 3 n=1 Tax=Podospora anserina (strain S / ATCC MYA-4624 / DSM 980 / FGSC 10383) TaxID=515849 RepID=B2AFF9_PODAN|nr:uncharacterized protein PODANS_5_12850 [Podospora anserina S mat+]CAP62178.1 unnamed protein product [Podospora anserina S mat+]CDP29248.1 Putative protein of unknown function [Podospora anserina S mat+]